MALFSKTKDGGVLEQMHTCECMGREADIERCCIAYRPASVRGVITRVETPHNTERQSEEAKKRSKWRKTHRCRQKTVRRQKLVSISRRQRRNLITPSPHLPSCHPGETIVNVFWTSLRQHKESRAGSSNASVTN